MYHPSLDILRSRRALLLNMSQHHVMPLSARVTPSPQPAAHIVCSPPWLPPDAMRSAPFHPLTVFRYCSPRFTRSTMPLKYATSGSSFCFASNA